MLYRYNEDGTYKEDSLVNSIDDVLIKFQEIKEIIKGEEVVTQVTNDIPYLPVGITNIKPTGHIIPNISPKWDGEKWIEDKEAIRVYKENLPKTKERLTYEEMDDVITLLAEVVLNNKPETGLLSYLKKKA